MGLQTTFHAPVGGDFLGWREHRSGVTEIVYEDSAAHRIVLRLYSPGQSDDEVAEALSVAVGRPNVLPSLFEELRKRAIGYDRIIG